jgi:hypothetical protein
MAGGAQPVPLRTQQIEPNKTLTHQGAMQNVDNSILSRLTRYRVIWFSSPLWIAAIFIALSLTSRSFRHVIEFMTASPLR